MQRNAKQNKDGLSRNQSSIMLEDCVASYSLNLMMKTIMKNARRKLEVPMTAAMPCKIPIKSSGETHRNIGKRKRKYACCCCREYTTHQDHITEKGMNSIIHYSLVYKFIPMPQAMKIPAAKAAVDKEWDQLEKIPAWQLTKVRNKKEQCVE